MIDLPQLAFNPSHRLTVRRIALLGCSLLPVILVSSVFKILKKYMHACLIMYHGITEQLELDTRERHFTYFF